LPLVSIIIPNYNHAAFLTKRIDSVLKQTFQDIEVIILDDCSKDNSRDIIQSYRHHPKVSHIIFNEQNSGTTFKQWKKGIELAKGEWIWIAESDDWCEPTLLEELIKPAIQNPELVIAFCQSLLFSPEGKIFYNTNAAYLTEIVDGPEFVRTKMLGVNHIINASTAIFRKSAYKQVSDGYEQMKYCGDWLFWVHVCLQGKVFISGKILNYYLRHENNVATMAVKKGYDFLEGNKIFDFIMKSVKVSPQEKEVALHIRLNMYLDRKNLFLNEEIQDQVYQSMLALDPTMKTLIKERLNLSKKKQVRSIIYRFLRFIK